jgi:hypothetical protein
MKKIYLAILIGAFSLGMNAQVTLTKAANEPVASDINSKKYYDSVGVVPKSTGAGQNWDFSTFTTTTVNIVSNYLTAGAVASSSNFPGTTLVEFKGADKMYWKSVATPSTQFELLGLEQPSGLTLTYTNSAIAAVWPIAMGYILVDAVSGTISAITQTGTVTGSITTQGSGTGSLVLPGNFPIYNILQLKSSNQIFISVPSSAYNATVTTTEYSYYSGTQKFPLITVSYEREVEQIGTPTVTLTHKIMVNNAVLTGLNEKNFDASFQIFPNPAKDAFHVNLENAKGEMGTIEIYSATGQLVKKIELENTMLIDQNISISDLNRGVYMVKTSLGERNSNRKLIVE